MTSVMVVVTESAMHCKEKHECDYFLSLSNPQGSKHHLGGVLASSVALLGATRGGEGEAVVIVPGLSSHK